MAFTRSRTLTIICAILLIAGTFWEADAKRRKKKNKEQSNPVIIFLEENGIDIDKKVVAIQVTGQQLLAEGPRAVMKVIAIRGGLSEGTRKRSADVIRTVIAFIVDGTVIETGDTEKVADLEIFFEDGSSFKVLIGEDFSQIVFEKIIKQPENPFSNEPVEKEVKVLSFISEGLTKSVKIILEPKGGG